MKRVKVDVEIIGIDELPTHCLVGARDKSGEKYFAVQVKIGEFLWIGDGRLPEKKDDATPYLNRWSPESLSLRELVKQAIKENNWEVYKFNSMPELFSWLTTEVLS